MWAILVFKTYWTFTISLVEGEKLGFRRPEFLLYGSSPCVSCGQKGWGGGCEYYKCECLTLPVCPEFGYDKEGLTRVLSPPSS